MVPVASYPTLGVIITHMQSSSVAGKGEVCNCAIVHWDRKCNIMILRVKYNELSC